MPSTPRAPKIGRIPLPEVEDVEERDIVLELKGTDHEEVEDDDDCSLSPVSPVSPEQQKRKGSASLSRSETPQTRCASRTSSSSYPRTPIIAPTPRIATLDEGWRRSSSPADVPERPRTTKPSVEKDRRTSLKARGPAAPTLHTPQPPITTSRERAGALPENVTARHEDRHLPYDSKRRRRVSSSSPSAVPPSASLNERARAPQPATARRPLKGILKSALSVIILRLYQQLTDLRPAQRHKWHLFRIRSTSTGNYCHMILLAARSDCSSMSRRTCGRCAT